jgi:uncharacterized membrane protein (UPF0136 family)
MKNKAYILFIYSTILLLGGIIGFLKTGSVISIFSAAFLTLILNVCGSMMLYGKQLAYNISLIVLFIILIFFGFRYILTLNLMPAGIMTILTLLTLGYCLVRKS